MSTPWIAAAAATLALLASPAAAQSSRVEIFSTEEMVTVEFGGGVIEFFDGMNEETDRGAAATLRAVLLPKSAVSAELAYVGGYNNLRAADDTMLAGITTHIGEALIRFEPLKVTRLATGAQPYVATGAGYLSHEITGENADEVEFSDTQLFELPAAVGVRAKFENLTFDGRVSYRYIFDDDVREDERATDVQSWTAMATVGMTF